MKIAARFVMVAALGLVVVPQAYAQMAARPAVTSLAGDILDDWQGQKKLIADAASAMPADKYSYKSTPAQRSYGEQVMHIVGANQMLLSTLGGKTPAPMINMKAATKDEIVAALRQSYEWGEALAKEFSEAQMVERVTPPRFMGPSASRARLFYGVMGHTQDIYGQMVVYLRLNGVTPPASVRPGV